MHPDAIDDGGELGYQKGVSQREMPRAARNHPSKEIMSTPKQNYSVTLIFDASKGMDVEAESPEQAEAMAVDALGSPCICHQCAAEVDVADAIGAHVYLGDKLVLDTTYGGDKDRQVAELTARVASLEAQLAAAAAAATKVDSTNNPTEISLIIDVQGGCVQSVYGDEMPGGTKLKVVLRDRDNIEDGDPDPVAESYQPAATYY